jgi:biopolymer transport protein TolR
MAFGRLERSADSRPMSEINMTPLIDVMLVLLVIFILTAPLMVGAVKVALPKAEATVSTTSQQGLAVTLTASGQIYVEDRALEIPALVQTFRTAAQSNPDTEVRLRADAAVPYGRVVELMGLAQKNGLNRIGFVAEPQHPSAP